MWVRGFVGATEGNLSVRLGENRFLCTPSGRSKGHLKPHDLVVVDAQGAVVASGGSRMGFREAPVAVAGGTPSSEIKMHLGIYGARPDVNAVVHAHPLFATSYAYAGQSIPTDLSPEGKAVVGSVALLPFAEPGTDAVPESFMPFVKDHNSFLLTNHGVTTVGETLEGAFNRLETVERLAQVMYQARVLQGK